jgi:drug/metabolite transporter (DMT)-like permease
VKTAGAIACAVGASLAFNYAMYMQKKAVGTLPEVKLQLSWTVLKAFLTNRAWVTSMFVVLAGSALYAFALTIAPISIVQPIMASGVALLAYLAIKNLGERPRRIDLVAIGLSILGVVLIGVSLAEGLPEDVKHSAGSLYIFTAAVVAVAIIIPLAMMRSSDERKAAGLGISCGLLYGTSAVFAKLLLVDWSNQWPHKGVMVLFASVFLLAWALTLVPAFIILQAALQKGMAIVVVPLLASLSQLVPILVGMIALHEPFPKSPALAVLRIIGFSLILVATVILSRRAEEAGDGTPDVSQADGPVAGEPSMEGGNA